MTRVCHHAPLDVVLICHLVGQFNVGVSVAETSHVSHLEVRELQQRRPFFIFHLHDVKDALHALRGRKKQTVPQPLPRVGALGGRRSLRYLFGAALDVLRGEEGQLFEVRVLGPHGLGDHLSQFHGGQGRTQPAVTGQDIDAGLDQTHRLRAQLRVRWIPVMGRARSPSNGHRSAPCSGSPRCRTAAQRSAAFWTGGPAAAGWSSRGDR